MGAAAAVVSAAPFDFAFAFPLEAERAQAPLNKEKASTKPASALRGSGREQDENDIRIPVIMRTSW